MRKALQLLLAASTILSSSLVSARMGNGSSSSGNSRSAMSAAVDFQTFELDGEVKNLLWCGNNDEIILLHADDGTVYRSRDRGNSWKRLKALMQKYGTMVADEDQEVSLLISLLTYHFALDRCSTQDPAESS